jgi:hypothetical protein
VWARRRSTTRSPKRGEKPHDGFQYYNMLLSQWRVRFGPPGRRNDTRADFYDRIGPGRLPRTRAIYTIVSPLRRAKREGQKYSVRGPHVSWCREVVSFSRRVNRSDGRDNRWTLMRSYDGMDTPFTGQFQEFRPSRTRNPEKGFHVWTANGRYRDSVQEQY